MTRDDAFSSLAWMRKRKFMANEISREYADLYRSLTDKDPFESKLLASYFVGFVYGLLYASKPKRNSWEGDDRKEFNRGYKLARDLF